MESSSTMGKLSIQSKPYRVTILPNIKEAEKKSIVTPVLTSQKTVVRQVNLPICQVIPKTIIANLQYPRIIPIANANSNNSNNIYCLKQNGYDNKMVIGQPLRPGIRPTLRPIISHGAPASINTSGPVTLTKAPLIITPLQQSQQLKEMSLTNLFAINDSNKRAENIGTMVSVAPAPQTLVTFTGSIGAISSSKITSEHNGEAINQSRAISKFYKNSLYLRLF